MPFEESTFLGQIHKVYPRHPVIAASGCEKGGSTTFFDGFLNVLTKKRRILIKKESESLEFTALEIPRDY